MNRRDALKLLLTGTAGLVLDPEKLLWVPGKKTFFIPSPAQIACYEGIPYHQTDASTASWLGFNRAFYGGGAGGGKTMYLKEIGRLLDEQRKKTSFM